MRSYKRDTMPDWQRNLVAFFAIIVPLVGIALRGERAWWIWVWLIVGVLACAYLLPEKTD